MFREMIQEYLVGLGVQIDKPGFDQMDRTLKTTEQAVANVTGSWAANFVKAGGIIGAAIAGITAAGAGMIQSAARQELEMEKLSRQMLVTTETALTMKRATDALGESLNDVLLSPELTRRFRQLTAEGREMQVGGDFKETMAYVRDVMFEFTRLRQEAQYALTWIGYYLAKYLARPLARMKESLGAFNDAFIKNMSSWTEKITKWIALVINAGLNFIRFLTNIGRTLWKVWESFPKGVKIAIAALTVLSAFMMASPLTRAIMLFTTLLLLIDDYFAYKEGRGNLYGEYWEKLDSYLESASEWADKLQESLEYLEEPIMRLMDAIKELGASILDFIETALTGFFEGLDDERVIDFKSAIKEVIEAVAELSEVMSKFFKKLSQDNTVKDFFRRAGKLVKSFTIEIMDAIKKTGYLGKALAALFDKRWGDAWKYAQMAFSGNATKNEFGFFGAVGREAAEFGVGIGRGIRGNSGVSDSWDDGRNGVPLYKQWDERWGDISFSQGTMSTSGCAPSSTAMAMSWAMGKEITPDEIAAYANENGLVGSDGVYGGSFIPSVAEHYGIEMVQTDDIEEVRRSLEQGIPVIVAHDPGVFTDYGHFNVYTGFDKNGRLVVNDPNGGGGFVEDNETFDFDALTQSDSADYYIFKNRPNAQSERMAVAYNPQADPYTIGGMQSGFMNTADGYRAAGLPVPSNNSVMTLNLGGITVNGNVDDPRALAQEVGSEVMNRLGKQGDFLRRQITVGVPAYA